MPIYEYACETCGHEFEYLVRYGDVPECPECQHATDLTRRLSVPAAHTNGAKGLPLAEGPGGNCGRPQCGTGGCMGLG